MDIFATQDKKYGTSVCGIGKALRETFLTRILSEKSKTLPPVVGTLSTFLVNKSGLDLQNLVTSSAEKYTSSLHAIYDLIDAVTGNGEF